MTSEVNRQALLDEVLSKQQMQEQLHRWTRGADRIDVEQMQSAFHPGANVNYGYSNGPVEEFLPWVVKFHSEDLVSTTHTIGNVLIRLDGELAWSEARVECCLRYQGKAGLSDLLLVGRYLDKWERRAGMWRIYDRTAVVDRYKTERVIQDAEVDPWIKGPALGLRTKADLSYQYV